MEQLLDLKYQITKNNNMSKIKILIVEDEPLIAEDIKECLEKMDYDVIAIAYDMSDALKVLETNPPDFALLDINLGGNTDGITIAEKINEKYNIPFIYLTSYSSKNILSQVKHTLPMGYVVKPFDEADLFSSIEIALFNYKKIVKPNAMTLELINQNIVDKLTKKEFEILVCLYHGCSNQIMAEKNFVSINTIKTHVSKIYEKLDTHSRSETIVKIRQLLESK